MAGSDGFDGTQIKKFVENEDSFNKYIDKKFKALDKDHKGVLSEAELKPMTADLGGALGLPPPGSSKETDHIYDEIFGEFGHGANVTKATFAHVVKDVYLGLADGLERDPISVLKVDGATLKEYAESGTFDTDTVSVFTRLDAKAENQLKAIMLVDALKTIPVTKGMPPAEDPSMKPLIKEALVSNEVNTDEDLDQYKFCDALKLLALSVASSLQKSPVNVAYSEKVYDGSGISTLLKDKPVLDQVLQSTWDKLPKPKKGKASKDYLRVGVDEMSPAAGLPPVGAVEEMDSVMKTVFSKIDLDAGGYVNQEEFNSTMLEVLGSMMMQLQGKPVTIKNAKVVDEESSSEGVL